MEYRKIIGFGNTSFVISLPKNWITHNKLKKGDSVSIDQTPTNELIIFPKPKEEAGREFKSVAIDVNNKSIYEIKRTIISAYLNSNTNITITGDNLNPISESLREIINDLAAIEIMEQTGKKIVVRDFLDMNTVALPDIIRKTDLIIRSMLTDMQENLNYPAGGHANISLRDKDVNKMVFLANRIIRYVAMHPRFQKKASLSYVDILELHMIMARMEEIGDALKRIARHIEKNLSKINKDKDKKDELKKLLSSFEEFYITAIRAYYRKDPHMASTEANRRPTITKQYNEFFKEIKENEELRLLAENMYSLFQAIRNILRISYQAN